MSDQIISLMHAQMKTARKMAAAGELTDHMHGYFLGGVSALAIAAGGMDAYRLSRAFADELAQLKEAA